MEFKLTTPVAFFIFNRPETTERVFEEIRRAQPPILMVVADGPRPDRPGEEERSAAARAIINRVDWVCQVLTNYSDTNLGVNARIISGLGWVFDNVEEAIILEDDCLPHPTFFPFCQELLLKHRDDERIMMISGENQQEGRKRMPHSYYYSRIFHIYGWATWRRAWRLNDPNLTLWPEIRDNGWLQDIVGLPNSERYFQHIFEGAFTGSFHVTWDFRWNFSCWLQSGLNIAPNVNMVTNIGFGADSTHTTDPTSVNANRPVEAMEFPLKHPGFMFQNKQADHFTMSKFFSTPGSDQPASVKKRSRKRRKRKGKIGKMPKRVFKRTKGISRGRRKNGRVKLKKNRRNVLLGRRRVKKMIKVRRKLP